MVTGLGKYLRKKRIDLGISMREMAKNISVSAATLSAIENGKQDIKESKISDLALVLKLSEQETRDFEVIALASNAEVILSLRNKSDEEAEVYALLARSLDDLSPDAAANIKDVILNDTRLSKTV